MPSDHPRSFSEAWPQGTRVKPTNGKFTWKIPILLTILWYLNSGTNNENFILAIFFFSDSSYCSLITKNHSASDITWPILAKIEARHDHSLAHTPFLYCKVRYQLIVVHFKVNSTISSQKVDLLLFFKETLVSSLFCTIANFLSFNLPTPLKIILIFTAVLLLFRVQKCSFFPYVSFH